jgi:hypothetical protein
MSKNLKVYPIPTGNELNVFATGNIAELRIMNLSGNIVYTAKGHESQTEIINIRELPMDTYIVEVVCEDNKHCRSMFVKL